MPTKVEDLPANFIFSPKEEFSWGRHSTYYPGNTYNCSDLPRHDPLREKCAQWLDEGKITITPVGGFKVTTMTIPAPEED